MCILFQKGTSAYWNWSDGVMVNEPKILHIPGMLKFTAEKCIGISGQASHPCESSCLKAERYV